MDGTVCDDASDKYFQCERNSLYKQCKLAFEAVMATGMNIRTYACRNFPLSHLIVHKYTITAQELPIWPICSTVQ